jgi:hypothetical protein
MVKQDYFGNMTKPKDKEPHPSTERQKAANPIF